MARQTVGEHDWHAEGEHRRGAPGPRPARPPPPPAAPTIIRLQLLQERLDLQDELEKSGSSERLQELEDAFVEHARSYGERKGISYAAWREIGVSTAVLKRAGIYSRSAAGVG
jgi:hypothetical protein